jgi:hypothetical protein
VPVRSEIGERGEQVEIHALVDDAEVAEPRARDGGLVLRLRLRLACGCEVRRVDAAREEVDVSVALALRLPQALAAGEDEVGTLQQLRFQVGELGRRAGERRQRVHAVVTTAAASSSRVNGSAIGV